MLAFRRRHLVPHPLILRGPGQQFPPEFFVHPAIPPHPHGAVDRALRRGMAPAAQ
jgi:hypothetical protein